MIARIWRGAVAQPTGTPTPRYMEGTGIAGYTKTPGNRGVWMLRRDVDGKTEFVMFTLWDSMEAITSWRSARGRRVLPRGRPLSRRARRARVPLRGRPVRVAVTAARVLAMGGGGDGDGVSERPVPARHLGS